MNSKLNTLSTNSKNMKLKQPKSVAIKTPSLSLKKRILSFHTSNEQKSNCSDSNSKKSKIDSNDVEGELGFKDNEYPYQCVNSNYDSDSSTYEDLSENFIIKERKINQESVPKEVLMESIHSPHSEMNSDNDKNGSITESS